jgi:hypothetical protein
MTVKKWILIPHALICDQHKIKINRKYGDIRIGAFFDTRNVEEKPLSFADRRLDETNHMVFRMPFFNENLTKWIRREMLDCFRRLLLVQS